MPEVAEMRVVAKVALLSVGIWWVLAGDAMSQEPEQGGRFNLELPTLGGKQFWADVRHFHKWRIQLNVVTGHYRLLDANNIRHAWGTLEECSGALESICESRSIPPMQGKAVVVLHGLMRSRSSMQGLSDYLEKKGGFQVFNVSYPTTRNEVGQHAKRLSGILNQLDGIEEINFVAHSLGNLVIRHYLGDAKKSETGPDPRIRRIVMLGPPNQGAEIAERFGRNIVFRWVAGSSGYQLAHDWENLRRHLATPEVEFGIIAGGRGKPSGNNPLLSGDDDMVVTVESAKLPGARDFVVLPLYHSFIMNDATSQEYILRFLQHGYFISQEKRHPLPEH